MESHDGPPGSLFVRPRSASERRTRLQENAAHQTKNSSVPCSSFSWLLSVLAGITLTLTSAIASDRQPVPELHARVTDLTNTLDISQTQTLTSELEALEKRKGCQIAVLIVWTTQPEDIAQYSIRVIDAWKLGR
jgi:hypothetical protein